ncbi:MAG: hypothetical protein Fur0037_17500 [Planctomycetota bacterium]
MTQKSALTIGAASSTHGPEPRPFLYLDPAPAGAHPPSIDPRGLDALGVAAASDVPALVRGLVNFTIARQNGTALESGRRTPIAMSVLNRRRRSARAWIMAVLSGMADRAALHALVRTWMPHLTASGGDAKAMLDPARECVEYLRGAITASIFDEPAENLLPHARALCALETVLSHHLLALVEAARGQVAV